MVCDDGGADHAKELPSSPRKHRLEAAKGRQVAGHAPNASQQPIPNLLPLLHPDLTDRSAHTQSQSDRVVGKLDIRNPK